MAGGFLSAIGQMSPQDLAVSQAVGGAFMGGMGSALNQAQGQALAAGPPPTPAPTLADLQAILNGPAPTAPSAADFGPAPSLSDFFSAAPYQSALQSLQQGGQQATGNINSNYNQAAQAMQQIAQIASQNQGAERQAMNNDAANAMSAVNGYVGNAEQAAGPGSGVASRLAALQATLAGQGGAEKNLADALQGIQAFNNNQDMAGLTTNRQGALDALNAAVTGEGNKINLAEANDQAKAQQMLNSANSARGTAMAKAGTDYQSALKGYQSSWDTILRQATAQANSQAISNQDAAKQTIENWASSNNDNGNALSTAANQIINGFTAKDGTKIGRANDGAEAIQRLNSSSIPQNSIEYNLLYGMLQQYYKPGKQTPSVMSVLQQMAGG